MSPELKKIVALLKAGEAELRCAAARVLTALAPTEDEVVEALAKAAGDDHPLVRTYSIDALKVLAKPKHVDLLIPLMDGPARDKVMPLVKDLGGNVLAALKKGLGDGAKRLSSAQAIAGLGGKGAFEALLKETADPDVEYVKAITNMIRGLVEAMPDPDREKAFETVSKVLDHAKERLQKVAAIRVMGYLRLPEAADVLIKLTKAEEHPSVRSRAIDAISLLNFTAKKPGATLIKTLLALLDDKDDTNIVQPALAALTRLPLPDSLDLEPLLVHPSAHVRVLGVQQLTARADKDSGHRLIELLEDQNDEVKDQAIAALRREPKFAAMLAHFMEKDAGGRVDLCVSILKGYRDGLPREQVAKFLKKGLEMFEKSGQQNWALEVAKSASMEHYREALFERALKLKKAKKIDASEKFLAQLIRDGGGDEAMRYELAVARLHISPKPDDPKVRAQSYALAMLKDLAKPDPKALLKKLKAEPIVDTPELAFAGLYFLGQEGLKDLGVEMLTIVAKGKSKEAASAKKALAAAGV